MALANPDNTEVPRPICLQKIIDRFGKTEDFEFWQKLNEDERKKKAVDDKLVKDAGAVFNGKLITDVFAMTGERLIGR